MRWSLDEVMTQQTYAAESRMATVLGVGAAVTMQAQAFAENQGAGFAISERPGHSAALSIRSVGTGGGAAGI